MVSNLMLVNEKSVKSCQARNYIRTHSLKAMKTSSATLTVFINPVHNPVRSLPLPPSVREHTIKN